MAKPTKKPAERIDWASSADGNGAILIRACSFGRGTYSRRPHYFWGSSSKKYSSPSRHQKHRSFEVLKFWPLANKVPEQ
jgi:hypothetical protein